MLIKNSIIKCLGHIVAMCLRKTRIVLCQASTEEFEKETNCKGSVHVNYPVAIKGGQYVTVGDGFFSNRGLRVECVDEYYGYKFSPTLTIGQNVSIGCQCHIGCINRIEIGNHVLLGSNVLIIDHSHGRFDSVEKDVPWENRSLYSKGTIVIEENVWICDNVSILPDVRIGKGSVVGAGSVVTKSIPPYSLAVGNPAIVIKQLKS